MANKKISELAELAANAAPAGDDVFPFTDITAPKTTKKIKVSNLMKAAPVQTVAGRDGTVVLTQADVALSEGAFVDGDKTKLDGIESSADVTDATNVEAAGALMDSEVTNLAAVKAFATTDYATAAQGTKADSAIQPATVPAKICIACSDETTDLTTGTAKATFRMPDAMALTSVRATVTTAPVGSVLTVDINEAGSTILSTKLTIDASEKTSSTAATAAVISDAALADDAEITIDIDGVGSSTAGAGLKVWLIGTWA